MVSQIVDHKCRLIMTKDVSFLSLFRLGCGERLSWWDSAWHAHLPHSPKEGSQSLQRTLSLPGRTVRSSCTWTEVPAESASIPRHWLCVSAELNIRPSCHFCVSNLKKNLEWIYWWVITIWFTTLNTSAFLILGTYGLGD